MILIQEIRSKLVIEQSSLYLLTSKRLSLLSSSYLDDFCGERLVPQVYSPLGSYVSRIYYGRSQPNALLNALFTCLTEIDFLTLHVVRADLIPNIVIGGSFSPGPDYPVPTKSTMTMNVNFRFPGLE